MNGMCRNDGIGGSISGSINFEFLHQPASAASDALAAEAGWFRIE
jgi:hypothetical protein